MTFVRDSDIRKILEALVSGNPLSVTIHPPFVCERGQWYRHYDKEYSLDGLTIFVEAMLGKYEKAYAQAQERALKKEEELHLLSTRSGIISKPVLLTMHMIAI